MCNASLADVVGFSAGISCCEKGSQWTAALEIFQHLIPHLYNLIYWCGGVLRKYFWNVLELCYGQVDAASGGCTKCLQLQFCHQCMWKGGPLDPCPHFVSCHGINQDQSKWVAQMTRSCIDLSTWVSWFHGLVFLLEFCLILVHLLWIPEVQLQCSHQRMWQERAVATGAATLSNSQIRNWCKHRQCKCNDHGFWKGWKVARGFKYVWGHAWKSDLARLDQLQCHYQLLWERGSMALGLAHLLRNVPDTRQTWKRLSKQTNFISFLGHFSCNI